MKPSKQQIDDIKTIPFNLKQCLAKTYIHEAKCYCGRDILEHSLITGTIAKKILEMKADWLFQETNVGLAYIIAALHDIGKITPLFQCKLYSFISDKNMPEALKKFSNYIEQERMYGYHSGAGQCVLNDCNTNKRHIAGVVGRHHGYSYAPKNSKTADILGGEEWQKLRDEFITYILSHFNLQEIPIIFQTDTNIYELFQYISGMVTISDWLASSSIFDNPKENWEEKAEVILHQNGFITPSIKKGLSFTDIFGFEPRAEQKALFENCRHRGVYLMEAPMGIGKTEAALYLAYKMLETGNATGIYFALPTKLTSDKIYERFKDFLENIIQDNKIKPLLIHSDSMLFGFDNIYEETNQQINAGWFLHKKRAILYPFAVGTIDQALMSVLNVKHGFVRAFGLAGKIVILDEVHCYDVYTGTVIDELVKSLEKMGCTVIILSATLTIKRRNELLKMYAPCDSKEYPLISGKKGEYVPPPLNNYKVNIETLSDCGLLIEKAVERACQGDQVLWIENTVSQAQNIFRKLSAITKTLDIETGLLHSKFIKHDRRIHENKWVDAYKKSSNKRASCGRILVGTQVLEQSLDIDSDLLITKLAPIDMLLQRIGRLWRHENHKRPEGAERKTYILCPSEDAFKNPNATDIFGKSAYVYSPYILYNTYTTIKNIKSINIPDGLRPLLEQVYDQERNDSGFVLEWKEKMLKRAESLRFFALAGLSEGKYQDDESASTRYSELESIEVLLLKEYKNNGENIELQFLTGEKVSFNKGIFQTNKKQWKEIWNMVNDNSLSVAKHQCPKLYSNNYSDWLKEFMYIGDFNNPHAGLAIIDAGGNVRDCFGNEDTNDKYKLSYNHMQGYTAVKK